MKQPRFVAFVVAILTALSGSKKTLNPKFALVFFNNHHIRKAISVVLLTTLLFIHSTKLLHTHSFARFDAKAVCDKSATQNNQESVHKIADCNICAYQINKDADDSFFLLCKVDDTSKFRLTIPSCLNELFSFFSASDSRGPPSLG